MNVTAEQTTVTPDSDLFKERVERCTPMVREIIKIVHENFDSIKLGDSKQCSDSVDNITAKILELHIEDNILWGDRQFIAQLVLQPFAHINEKIETALGISWEKALKKMFGKDATELTFKDVDTILKAD